MEAPVSSNLALVLLEDWAAIFASERCSVSSPYRFTCNTSSCVLEGRAKRFT